VFVVEFAPVSLHMAAPAPVSVRDFISVSGPHFNGFRTLWSEQIPTKENIHGPVTHSREPQSTFPALPDSVHLIRCPCMKIIEAHNLFLSYGRGERNYTRETLAKLKDCFRAWILPALGEIDIGALTRMDVIRLRTAMVDRGIGIARQYGVLMTLKSFCK